MSDLHPLLEPSVSVAAREAARLPDYEGLRKRGLRRQRTRVALLGTALALTTVAGSASISALFAQDPAPLATTAPRSAVEIVDAEDSWPTPVLSPDDDAVRAVRWTRCTVDCARRESAIAITRDGFRTRAVLPWVSPCTGGCPINGELRYVGQDVFALEPSDPGDPTYLLHADGSTTEVVVRPMPAGQENVRPSTGSVLVRLGPDPEDWAAVDPQTGVGSPQSVPAGLSEAQVLADGRILGLDRQAGVTRFVASDDVGETWRETTLSRTSGELWSLAAGNGQDLAILVGTDSSSDQGRLDRVLRSDDGGRTFATMPVDQVLSQLAEAGVLADGRLMLDVPVRAPGGSMGFFWSEHGGWQPASFGRPFSRPGERIAIVSGPQGALLIGQLGTSSYRSEDGGRTWRETRLR